VPVKAILCLIHLRLHNYLQTLCFLCARISVLTIIMKHSPSVINALQVLKRVSNSVGEVGKKTGQYVHENRYRIIQTVILFLRFGQIAATAILALVYFYFVYEHRTHFCHYYPIDWSCQYHRPKLDAVPVSYILVLIAVSFIPVLPTSNLILPFQPPSTLTTLPPLTKFPVSQTQALSSFLQLFTHSFLSLFASTKSRPISLPLRHHTRTHFLPHTQHYGLLLFPSDAPILALYIAAFATLSDYVVPTHILRGARPGSTCYLSNMYNKYAPVVLQQCVLGQHGYWWVMGAM
jgi:hypothetical protein